MSLILPSRNVLTTGLLSVGSPSASLQCAEPIALSSLTWASEQTVDRPSAARFQDLTGLVWPASRRRSLPPEVAAREAAPLGIFGEERGEGLGVALVQRLGCRAKLLNGGGTVRLASAAWLRLPFVRAA